MQFYFECLTLSAAPPSSGAQVPIVAAVFPESLASLAAAAPACSVSNSTVTHKYELMLLFAKMLDLSPAYVPEAPIMKHKVGNISITADL